MAWNDTQEGVDLNNAFENMRNTYQVYIPQFLASLGALAVRPITG